MANSTNSSSNVSSTSSNSTSSKGTNMKRNRNRSTKRDANLSSKEAFYASAANSAQHDRAAADAEARELARREFCTFEQVCEVFPGLNEELDSHITQLLIHTGVLDSETMLMVEGLTDRDAWLNQSAAHKNAVAMMKSMLNRVPQRDENGEVVRFGEGHHLAGKVRMVRVGTRTLPEFNDGSENAPHGKKEFTTTECAAIHKEFWAKWAQHPVIAEIVAQHAHFQAQSQIDSANKGRKTAKSFKANEVATSDEVRAVKRGQSGSGFNVMSAALEGVRPTHQTYIRQGKEIKRRIPRRDSKNTSAE